MDPSRKPIPKSNPNQKSPTNPRANYKALTVLNLLALVLNLSLIALNLVSFIFDRPPSYIDPALGKFLWDFGGIISGVFLLTAFCLAIFLALAPYNPQEKRAARLTVFSIANIVLGCFSIYFSYNVNLKMFLPYAIIPLIFLVAIHLAHPQRKPQTLPASSKPVSSQSRPTKPTLQAKPAHQPLIYFIYFIVAVELGFFLLSLTGKLTGTQLSTLGAVITAIVSLVINLFLLVILSKQYLHSPSRIIAFILCLWPIAPILTLAIATFINSIL